MRTACLTGWAVPALLFPICHPFNNKMTHAVCQYTRTCIVASHLKLQRAVTLCIQTRLSQEPWVPAVPVQQCWVLMLTIKVALVNDYWSTNCLQRQCQLNLSLRYFLQYTKILSELTIKAWFIVSNILSKSMRTSLY